MMGFSTDEPAQPRDAETRAEIPQACCATASSTSARSRSSCARCRAGVEIMAPPGMEEMQQQLQSMFQNLGGGRTQARASVKVREALQAAHRGRGRQARQRGGAARPARWPMPSRTASSSSTRSTRSRAARRPSAPTSRARACSATCCRWSKAARCRTKYGTVKTDHVLFIASGAFHMSKPSDLIPELQGRFPIRVELESLERRGLRAHPHRARRLADRAVPARCSAPSGARSSSRPTACAASPRSPSR